MATVKSGKTFTEAEVNEIVRSRLARQARKKAAKAPQEQRATEDLLSAAGRFTAELPSYGFDRWLKAAIESKNDLLERMQELRADDPEGARLQTMVAAIDENIQEVRQMYADQMKPVPQEPRALTHDQEIDVVLDYAFKRDPEKAEIRDRILRTNEEKTDPASRILRTVFQRG